MGLRRQTRRQFLETVVLAASSGLSVRCSPHLLEGIYVDRFTYRIGETVRVHGALLSETSTRMTILRADTAEPVTVFNQDVPFTIWQSLIEPGVFGPSFAPVLDLDTSGLPPGIYEVLIPTSAFQPGKELNTHNPFHSQNRVARFVLTPLQPGSLSRILWLFDTGTATAYNSFGGQSIYGPPATVKRRTVSMRRPGIERAQIYVQVAHFLQEQGYEFEYLDTAELDAVPAGYLDAYDLVLAVGQFEYLTNRAVAELERFIDAGGNFLCACQEFGIFRVRLEPATGRFTTFKFDWESEDPLAGIDTAGVGMNAQSGVFETQPGGQTVWAAHRSLPGESRDLRLANYSEAGWIWEGTGLGEGDLLNSALGNFNSGTLIDFDDNGQPFTVNHHLTRQAPDTVVWGVAPAGDARAWWLAQGSSFPLIQGGGWATGTWQHRSQGGQVVSLPSGETLRRNLGNPTFERILLNVMQNLA